ncbi:hypothetical protein [Helicobacter sp. 13S00477-4]|nr:hypothetical protein [Helicobacter sp. 13S00477-4]
MKILMTSFMCIFLYGCAFVGENAPLTSIKQPQYISDSERTIWIPRQ